MAEKTPVKALLNGCRCCNSGFANHPIDLLEAKAESENLLLKSYRECNGSKVL